MARRLLSCILFSCGGLVLACSGQPTAMEVCKKLEGVGVAENCRDGQKIGPSAIAKEKVEFDVPKLAANRPSEVLTFDQDREFMNTVKSYNELGTYNGMHRIGNAKRRVLVAIHEEAAAELADRAKKVVDEL
jgi:hypothetical protein